MPYQDSIDIGNRLFPKKNNYIYLIKILLASGGKYVNYNYFILRFCLEIWCNVSLLLKQIWVGVTLASQKVMLTLKSYKQVCLIYLK